MRAADARPRPAPTRLRNRTARTTRARPDGRGYRPPRSARARAWSAHAAARRLAATPRTSGPARSPTARAPRGDRAAPRAPGAGRRPARASLRNELEPVRDVARLPAGGLDLGAQPVGLLEIACRSSGAPPFGELDDLRRRVDPLRQGREPEDVERPPEQLVVTPAVHPRQRVRRLEVVLECGRERLPLPHRLRLPAEDLAEAVDARVRRRHRLVGEVDRL